uniref:DRBM domain-containing protein n=1 Tax=Oryza punctata TaxID=4537 RepID=A0A0E0M185_ORYPU
MATPVQQDSIIPVNTWEEDELELEEEEQQGIEAAAVDKVMEEAAALSLGVSASKVPVHVATGRVEQSNGGAKHANDSIVRQQHWIEATAMAKVMEEAAALSLGVSASSRKEPVHGANGRVEQSNGGAKHANGTTDNEPARLRLHKVCSAAHWKEPSYDFEEQGPSHLKLFTCKVTIHVDTVTSTIVECISEPKRCKKAAQEHAAQGALWYLKIFGHAN